MKEKMKGGNLFSKIYVLLICNKQNLSTGETEKISLELDKQHNIMVDRPKTAQQFINTADIKPKKVIPKKILIPLVAIVLILIFGIAAVAGIFNIFNSSLNRNKIHHGEANSKSSLLEAEDDSAKFDTIEELQKNIDFKMPIFDSFPESLTPSNILLYRGDIPGIFIIYSNDENKEMLKISYKYYGNKAVENETGIDEKYDYVGSFEFHGNTVHIYSDMERRITEFSYGSFIITLETFYTKEQLQNIIENMKN